MAFNAKREKYREEYVKKILCAFADREKDTLHNLWIELAYREENVGDVQTITLAELANLAEKTLRTMMRVIPDELYPWFEIGDRVTLTEDAGYVDCWANETKATVISCMLSPMRDGHSFLLQGCNGKTTWVLGKYLKKVVEE